MASNPAEEHLTEAESLSCPRCGYTEVAVTDKAGLDNVLAQHYSKKGFGLIEVCMCADPRQLSVMWSNVYRKLRGTKTRDKFLVCPECAFWQITD